jgi:hypothetical protein
MSCVNQDYVRRLAGRILGSKRMRMGGGYLVSAAEYKHEDFCDEVS